MRPRRSREVSRFGQCAALVHRQVPRFVALHFVLRIVGAAPPHAALEFHVFGMHLGDRAEYLPCLRVPAHVVAHCKPRRHLRLLMLCHPFRRLYRVMVVSGHGRFGSWSSMAQPAIGRSIRKAGGDPARGEGDSGHPHGRGSRNPHDVFLLVPTSARLDVRSGVILQPFASACEKCMVNGPSLGHTVASAWHTNEGGDGHDAGGIGEGEPRYR